MNTDYLRVRKSEQVFWADLYFLNFLASTILLLRLAKMTSKHYFKRERKRTQLDLLSN